LCVSVNLVIKAKLKGRETNKQIRFPAQLPERPTGGSTIIAVQIAACSGRLATNPQSTGGRGNLGRSAKRRAVLTASDPVRDS
jgi:hypothetical protein